MIRLGPADAERYVALRRRMLADAPWAFAASADDDRASDPRRVEAMLADERSALLAVAAGVGPGARPPLAAAAGIVGARHRKAAHRASIWGVYTLPEFRGRGYGAAVMRAALDVARTWPGVDRVGLSVSERSPEALRLYERLGFRVWGREPEALVVDGRRLDELYLDLALAPVPDQRSQKGGGSTPSERR